MAVSVQINANASAVKDALRDIEQAIARAGQTGRQFAQLDLSHPELAGLANDIRTLSQRFEDLGKVGRGATASAFRSIQNQNGGNYSDPLAWQFGVNRAFASSPSTAAQHIGNVGGYVTAGTRWAPGANQGGWNSSQQQSPPPGSPNPLPPPQAAGGGLGSLLGGLAGGAGFALGLAGINSIKSVITQSLGKAGENSSNVEDVYRHTDQVGTYDALRDAIMKSTQAFGVNSIEAARMTLSWQRMTGESGAAATAGTRLGVGFARSYGMDPGATVQNLAQASNAGIDPRTFAIMVGEAAAKGGRSADETSATMLRIAQQSASMFIDKLGTNLVQAGGFLSSLNATGIPGMRNGGSEAIMQTLSNSLVNPGGGVAGEAFMFSAMARQGVTDPYRQRYEREGGLFNKLPSGATNYEAVHSEIMRQYPGDSENAQMVRADAMENLTGLKMRQALALEKVKPGDLSTTFKALSNAGINPENLNPSSISDVVRISNTSGAGLEQVRQSFLGRSGQGSLSSEDQQTLRSAGPDSLQGALLRMAEKYGQSETEGSRTREADAVAMNGLIKVGQDMLPMLNDLKVGLGTLGGELGDLGSILTDVYKAAKGDPGAGDNLMFWRKSVQAGGGEAPLSDAASRERESQLMALYQSPEGGGYTRNQAAGLTEQAMAENGGRAHGPAGDGGAAIGMYQWHPDRVAAIEKRFGKKISDMSWQEQALAKSWELSPEGPEAEAGRKLRATKSAYDAGYSETVNDERPAYKEWKGMQRGLGAENIANPGAIPQASIAPLEVIHRDATGNILGNQALPVTQVDPPAPWGPPRVGQQPKTPPPPAPPAMGSAAWWGIS